MAVFPKGVHPERARGLAIAADAQAIGHGVRFTIASDPTIVASRGVGWMLLQLFAQEVAHALRGACGEARQREAQAVKQLIGMIEVNLVPAEAERVVKRLPRRTVKKGYDPGLQT